MHSAALEVMNTIVTISAGQGTKELRPTSFQLEAYMGRHYCLGHLLLTYCASRHLRRLCLSLECASQETTLPRYAECTESRGLPEISRRGKQSARNKRGLPSPASRIPTNTKPQHLL